MNNLIILLLILILYLNINNKEKYINCIKHRILKDRSNLNVFCINN